MTRGGSDLYSRFTRTVEAYRKHRPSYPEALLEWVVEAARLKRRDTLVDLGCGTGIASRALARTGARVVGLDPNADMLRAGAATGSDVVYVRGAAEHLPLRDDTMDAATGGQCFHWFDLDRVLGELARVLRPGAVCIAFWNSRDRTTPFLSAYEDILREHCSDYPLASVETTLRALREHPAASNVREAEFPFRQRFDRAGLLGRAWSSSYVVHSVRDASAFDDALTALFETHERGGRIELRYRTRALAFEPA